MGQENSLTSSLVPSFPPSFPPFLPQTTHFYMNPFIFPPPSHFCHPPPVFVSTFILSPRVFLSLYPTQRYPTCFFCHGQGRVNEQPESREKRGWRKEEREQGGELCPAEEERDGCSTCRDSAHRTRSSCPCDGSSRQELSVREQNAKKKKRPTPNGAAAERKPIHPRFFFFISGCKTIFRTNLYSRFFGLNNLRSSGSLPPALPSLALALALRGTVWDIFGLIV